MKENGIGGSRQSVQGVELVSGGAVLGGVGLVAYFLQRTQSLRVALQQGEETRRVEQTTAQKAQRTQEAETALLCQEYEALLENCGVGVLILNAVGVIERTNKTALTLLRASSQSLAGKSLLEATLSQEMSGLLGAAQMERRTLQREVQILGSTGISLRVSVVPIATKGVGQERFLIVVSDVTELRRLETVRRDFVANVSHELRTPLTSIRAMAETLQDGALKDPDVADRFLETIVTEAQRLARISEDLLVLSQAESRSPEKTHFDLSSLLMKVVNRLQPQAKKADILLKAEIPLGLEVLANYDQIEQVVINLLDNAIKYTQGGGKIYVTAETAPAGITVSITDTGIGILTQDLPRIFERFYRVDKARSRQSGGTGLGLSIVKHIVEAHGGQVTVKSEYNHGSTFSVLLPVEESPVFLSDSIGKIRESVL